MYYMDTRTPAFAWSRRSFSIGMLREAAPLRAPRFALAESQHADLTHVSADRMDEIAQSWRGRKVQGDRSADLVADALSAVAQQRREKAARSRLQSIRLGLASLTKY